MTFIKRIDQILTLLLYCLFYLQLSLPIYLAFLELGAVHGMSTTTLAIRKYSKDKSKNFCILLFSLFSSITYKTKKRRYYGTTILPAKYQDDEIKRKNDRKINEQEKIGK